MKIVVITGPGATLGDTRLDGWLAAPVHTAA